MRERNYLIHPYYIILTLILAGVTALFLGFSASFLYSRFQEGAPSVQLPQLFYWNTLLLVGCSYLLVLTKKAYLHDQTSLYQKLLAIIIVITLVFLIMQVIAWKQMYDMNITIQGSNMGSYLYVISAIHFVHVVAGIPFLCVFLYSAIKRMKEPVSVLVYFSDPDKKRKLNLLTIYWHYLDALWIYLVIFFLLNYLL